MKKRWERMREILTRDYKELIERLPERRDIAEKAGDVSFSSKRHSDCGLYLSD